MEWPETVIDCLKSNDIRVIAYVPDAIVWRVLEKIQPDPFFRMVRATREDEAVGIVAGAYMGGGRGAVFMQNSGVGNCINAFGSLCIAARIPIPMFVNMRGELGEMNLAQVPMGHSLRPILDSMGLQHFTPTRQDEVAKTVDGALKVSYSSRLPVAVLFSSLLTGGKYA